MKFSSNIAQWVSREQWHPEQEGRFDKGGNYLLSLPYAHETELIMDILRYGPDVEVISPQSFKASVKKRLERALVQYRPNRLI